MTQDDTNDTEPTSGFDPLSTTEEEKCVDELTNDLADTLDIDREVFDDLRPPSKERDTDGSKHTK